MIIDPLNQLTDNDVTGVMSVMEFAAYNKIKLPDYFDNLYEAMIDENISITINEFEELKNYCIFVMLSAFSGYFKSITRK